MVTAKEFYELSEQFQQKCELKHDKEGCDCPFYDPKTKNRTCPDFYFERVEDADQLFEFLEIKQDIEMTVGEALSPYKMTSPHFVDCTFNDCEIYCHDLS